MQEANELTNVNSRGCSRIFLIGEFRADSNLERRENRDRYFVED